MNSQGDAHSFPTTQWIKVRASGEDDTIGREALGALLLRYRPALRSHLVLARRLAPDRADDLVQSFITCKFIETNIAARAVPDRGRFRTFVLTALDNFVADDDRRTQTGKRSPDRAVTGVESLETYIGADSPRDVFDVAWARSVLAQAVNRMKSEFVLARREDVWGVFECRVLRPALHNEPAVDYAELVRRYNIPSPTAASNLLMTGKRAFERHLRAVIAEYAEAAGVEDEIRDLHRILSGGGIVAHE